jgi:hypothetical protein
MIEQKNGKQSNMLRNRKKVELKGVGGWRIQT